MAISEQTDEQGLREAVRQCGGVRLRGHDPFDGKEVSPCLSFSKQFLHALQCIEVALSRLRSRLRRLR